MDCLNLILGRLDDVGIIATVSDYNISWANSVGEESYIQLGNFDCCEDKLAWFQSSDNDEYLLKVYEGNEIFSWRPITYNPYFGCICQLLEWYNDHLIFIYTEKHDTYICSIKDKQVQTFNFYGYQLARFENLILFQENGEYSKVRRIRIPDLVEVDPLPIDEAERAGLLPQTLLGANPLKLLH